MRITGLLPGQPFKKNSYRQAAEEASSLELVEITVNVLHVC